MMDLLLVHECSFTKIGELLSDVFICEKERIRVFGIDEFNSLTEELDESTLDCVCVSTPMRGDASQLLQLYRYKVVDSVAYERIVEVMTKKRIRCFIPSDTFDGWNYVGDGGEFRIAHQLECDEENCVLFELA